MFAFVIRMFAVSFLCWWYVIVTRGEIIFSFNSNLIYIYVGGFLLLTYVTSIKKKIVKHGRTLHGRSVNGVQPSYYNHQGLLYVLTNVTVSWWVVISRGSAASWSSIDNIPDLAHRKFHLNDLFICVFIIIVFNHFI